MRNFCNLIDLEQWCFSLIWNTYMWKLQTFCGYKYHSWYFKIVSNFTRLTDREITYTNNNFEISLVVMPNIATEIMLLPIQILREKKFCCTWAPTRPPCHLVVLNTCSQSSAAFYIVTYVFFKSLTPKFNLQIPRPPLYVASKQR